MTISVIGCGNTAKNWFETKSDLSIGVNDCFKFGHAPNHLVLIDSPKRFTKQRQEIIKSTPSKFICRDDIWKGIIPNYERIRLQTFSKYLKKGHIYCSKTSTFVALSVAFNMNATDIILFGVDLVNHATFKGKLLDYELRQYERFCRMLAEQGIQVYVSSAESSLSKFLPVYEHSIVNC